MKVLFLSASGSLGGAEISLLEILASLRDACPEWPLHLLLAERGLFQGEAEAIGVVTTVLPFPSGLAGFGDSRLKGKHSAMARVTWLLRSFGVAWSALGYLGQMRKMIREAAPELIHVVGFKMQVLAALAKPAGVPMVVHVHDYISTRPAMRWLMRLLGSRYSVAVANSDSVAADIRLATNGAVPVERIYNSVDSNALTPVGEQLDLDALAQLPPPTGSLVRVGLVATFARWKGQEVFLRAIQQVDRAWPFRAYIVGGPVYQTQGSQYSLDELQALAVSLGIADRVGFTGFIKNRASAFRALDIVVHASTEPEPFGMVIIEAMSCGRALIAAGGGGAGEITIDGADALVHRAGDVADLAEKITRLVQDAELRKRLAQNGREKVVGHFSRARLAEQFVPIYSSLVTS